MGRGDMRTKKGKRFAGSFGNVRSARTPETTAVASAPVEKKEKAAKAPAKKAAPKKKAAEKE